MSQEIGIYYSGEAQEEPRREVDRHLARHRLVSLSDSAKAGLLLDLAERFPRLLLELTRESSKPLTPPLR
jgi:hypothetical protein